MSCVHGPKVDSTTPASAEELQFKSDGEVYTVVVHAREVRSRLKAHYSTDDLRNIERDFSDTLKITVGANGFVQAANRELGGEKDSTNYDAIWLRDSLWAHLGLKAAGSPDATRVLARMLDYLSSPAQLRRLENIIHKPSLATGVSGKMEVLHIRFDGNSPDFLDVMANGQPQDWNHRQNDATGLFLDLILRALNDGEVPAAALNDAHWKLLTGLPCYFAALKFYQMEDAGPWEEIDRVNSSSIGLVTSALENLQQTLARKPATAFARAYRGRDKRQCAAPAKLEGLIKAGYDRLRRQLAAGGESPLYALGDPRYRRADAALLNLIYPARLGRLTRAEKMSVLRIIQPLIGRVGIKRYLFDSYQSGNFWLAPQVPQAVDSRTDDTSSSDGFAERGKQFLGDTEAQWFFDSWISIVYGVLYQEKQDPALKALQIRHLNRALGQITAGPPHLMTAADGKPVPALALPESYNQLVSGDTSRFVPSPITPLNWAKASLVLASKIFEGSRFFSINAAH